MLHSSRPAIANLIASLSLLNHVRPAAAADTWTASFVFPATTGYVMHNMDVMEVSYTSNYPNASLWAFCYNGRAENANQIIMGVYKSAHALDGSQLFSFNNDFSSDNCWYNLRNLDNEEKGLNGVRFSYDWKTRDKPSTLKLGSRPEITDAPSSTATDAPASTSATATPAPPASSTSAASTGASSGGGGSGGGPSAGSGPTTTALGSSSGMESSGGSGAIAGIVVGAVLGVLGISGLSAALWLMKRRRRAAGRRSTLGRFSRRPRESKDTIFGRAEADGKCLPGELCGDNKPSKEGLVELPG